MNEDWECYVDQIYVPVTNIQEFILNLVFIGIMGFLAYLTYQNIQNIPRPLQLKVNARKRAIFAVNCFIMLTIIFEVLSRVILCFSYLLSMINTSLMQKQNILIHSTQAYVVLLYLRMFILDIAILRNGQIWFKYLRWSSQVYVYLHKLTKALYFVILPFYGLCFGLYFACTDVDGQIVMYLFIMIPGLSTLILMFISAYIINNNFRTHSNQPEFKKRRLNILTIVLYVSLVFQSVIYIIFIVDIHRDFIMNFKDFSMTHLRDESWNWFFIQLIYTPLEVLVPLVFLIYIYNLKFEVEPIIPRLNYDSMDSQ